MLLTWKEFKQIIDTQMKEEGIPESAELEYIDISYPCSTHPSCYPKVYFGDLDETIAIH